MLLTIQCLQSYFLFNLKLEDIAKAPTLNKYISLILKEDLKHIENL
jgi:hypothetical protein